MGGADAQQGAETTPSTNKGLQPAAGAAHSPAVVDDGRTLCIYRTYSTPDGKQLVTRREEVRNPALIDAYLTFRANKDPEDIKVSGRASDAFLRGCCCTTISAVLGVCASGRTGERRCE